MIINSYQENPLHISQTIVSYQDTLSIFLMRHACKGRPQGSRDLLEPVKCRDI